MVEPRNVHTRSFFCLQHQGTVINDWGQEVICETTSPNVTVQRFADKSISIYDYNQNYDHHSMNSYQILTQQGVPTGEIIALFIFSDISTIFARTTVPEELA